MNTFYFARTDGLIAVVGGGPDDRRRTADATAAFERRAAAATVGRRRTRRPWTVLAWLRLPDGYRGRRWQGRAAAQPGC